MKKQKIVGMLCFVTGLSVVLFNGCDKHIRMNTDKCAEVALEYLQSKYQTVFEVVDSSEKMKIGGPAGYTEVRVKNKLESEENEYIVLIYPDGSSDSDKDGYYDSYKVVADDYMCHLLYVYIKNEVDNLLMKTGLTRFISSIWIEQKEGIYGFSGFAADFQIQSEGSFSLNDLLDNYGISMNCWLEIPESEYVESVQNNITNIMKPLVSADDFISFDIEVYPEEIYKEREKLFIHDRRNILRGVASINFSIKEEESEDES